VAFLWLKKKPIKRLEGKSIPIPIKKNLEHAGDSSRRGYFESKRNEI